MARISNLPFLVQVDGKVIARFENPDVAGGFAHMWSVQKQLLVELFAYYGLNDEGNGIVGQFNRGFPSEEFGSFDCVLHGTLSIAA